MNIAIGDLIVSLSIALDYVEKELLGVTDYHSRRIAYLSYLMGQSMGLSKERCVALAEAAMLHDNALKEFVEDEATVDELGRVTPKHDEAFMTKHCLAGEENIAGLPFYPLIEGAVLYHHERADGSGAFGKLARETPLAARIIHITDVADATWNLGSMTEARHGELVSWVRAKEGEYFDGECVDAFLRVCTMETLAKLAESDCADILRELIDQPPAEVSARALVSFADIFARIIDYKSHFTFAHSLGIAKKARQMAEGYGMDEETRDKLYIAGALHDVGKLMISNDILEKPDRLTQSEYSTMQDHARATYDILSAVRGMEDITLWASLHHEKLDGSGYPFGKTAEELGRNERLLACLDIYQALVEKRPYKDGMPHEAAMAILNGMAARGSLTGIS